MDCQGGVAANLTAPGLVAVADIVSATGDAATDLVQPDLVVSLTSLLDSIGVLSTVGDTVANVSSSCVFGRSTHRSAVISLGGSRQECGIRWSEGKAASH